MHMLPLAHQIPQDALRGLDAEIRAIGQNLDRRAQSRAFLVARHGRLKLLFPAVDVVHDGDVLGAILFQGGHGGEFRLGEVDPHGEAHEGGEEAWVKSVILVCGNLRHGIFLTLCRHLSRGIRGSGLIR